MGDVFRKKIAICGVVQGVGFRPFVYRLAREHGLAGWVLNHSGGVEIEVEGPSVGLEAFWRDLQAESPPLARIEGISAVDYPPNGYTTFEIRESRAEEGRYQLVSPDIATCPDCQRELFDPADRRYRYPFTNCTNCGPRFTIIADIPYDRPNTTMRLFPMCPHCQREYDDPANRRFHAQPNACPVCGPHLWLVPGSMFQGAGSVKPEPLNLPKPAGDPLAQAAELLRAGYILALKGLGGFHLACDAANQATVHRLRERKRRPAKPLAVMIASLEEIRRHCRLSEEEARLLTSPQCPIVLLPWQKEGSNLCELVAPRHQYLGVMLPYTPLHHVLLREVGGPLVMTSGNLSEEPIAQENEEALRRLSHLADYFLMHNRDIYARFDDSVWFVPRPNLPQPIRRSRGYAPFPVKLPFKGRPILACGAELKNTFCLTRDQYAFLSQHIGDMENLETLEHFETTIKLYKRLFRIEPEIVAYDLHPAYLSTQYAKSQFAIQSQVAVQHHHAHVAACLADNGWRLEDGAVIGVALDGTGYGEDGTIWGGEWLVGNYQGFRRMAHLEYLPLPGGEAAIAAPWRLAAGYLYTLLGPDAVPPALIPASWADRQGGQAGLPLLYRQLDRRINTPLTSSMGRLFDAVSALLGVCTEVTYEAQAAVELEMVSQNLRAGRRACPYPFEIGVEGLLVIRLRALFEALRADLQGGASVEEVAYRFHVTIAEMIKVTCERIAGETGLQTVALSGGCFQNRLLLKLAVPLLEEAGFRVLLHRQVPCNDGGLSLGQAAIAHMQMGVRSRS